MCAIAGILAFQSDTALETSCQQLLQALAHRGQDHVGTQQVHPQVILGHRRLSIIDLHENAAQPMSYKQQLWISYNGEIYNYRELKQILERKGYTFETESDTEVLLAAYHYWQDSCVDHLNGMFAFAIWDAQKERLFCARDHLGIKPFYYSKDSTSFRFASESRALAQQKGYTLNQESLYYYLLTLYVPTQASIFAEIQQLPPAHTLTLDLNGVIQLKRYWQIQAFATYPASDQKAEVANLESYLHHAIERQCRSDVPVGGFLSGGIDSGLITAIAAEKVARYHTYSISYEGMAPEQNELPHAQLVATRYGTIHSAVTISAQEAVHYLDLALRNLSEPIADPAIVGTYVLAECAARDGVKVLLNGTGGDEIFGGYTRYTGQLSWKRRLAMRLQQPLQPFMSWLPVSPKTRWRMQYPVLDMLFSTGGSYALLAQVLRNNDPQLNAVLGNLQQSVDYPRPSSTSNYYQRMLVDIHTYLPNELLQLLDQMTMAHTLEGRVPLLDVKVVEQAFQFQAHNHFQGGETKTLLKAIAKPYLGERQVKLKKQGFAGSPLWWVKAHFKECIERIADTKKRFDFPHFNIDHYAKASLCDAGLANDIFILYCLNTWHGQFVG